MSLFFCAICLRSRSRSGNTRRYRGARIARECAPPPERAGGVLTGYFTRYSRGTRSSAHRSPSAPAADRAARQAGLTTGPSANGQQPPHAERARWRVCRRGTTTSVTARRQGAHGVLTGHSRGTHGAITNIRGGAAARYHPAETARSVGRSVRRATMIASAAVRTANAARARLSARFSSATRCAIPVSQRVAACGVPERSDRPSSSRRSPGASRRAPPARACSAPRYPAAGRCAQ